MAIIETSVSREVAGSAATTGLSVPSRGAASFLGSGDHKRLGRWWIAASLSFGAMALAVDALVALGQRSGSGFVLDEFVQPMFVLGRVGLVFLLVVPLFIGLATYVVPLQVGSATVAFPRGSAAAFWTWLFGTLMVVGSTAAGGGFGGSNQSMVGLSLVSLVLVLAALMAASVLVATTVITMRVPDMDLTRVPMFAWSMVVAASVWSLTLPVAIANLTLVFLDNQTNGPTQVGLPVSHWGQLQWLFTQPQVFAWAIPALGIVADAVATMSGRRPTGRGLVRAGIGAIGILAIGAWVQPAFVAKVYDQTAFVLVSVLVMVPLLAVAVGVAMSGARSPFRVVRSGGRSVVGMCLVSLSTLVLAGAVAIAFVVKPLRLHGVSGPDTLSDLSKFTWGQPAVEVGLTGLVVLGAVAAGLAGLYYWGPKLTGHRVGAVPARLVVVFLALAALMYGLPYVILGFSARWTSVVGLADTLDLAVGVGAVLAISALVLGAGSLLSSLTADDVAADPWGVGQTLEWACPSPPPRGNFAMLAEVTSAQPLFDWRGEFDR